MTTSARLKPKYRALPAPSKINLSPRPFPLPPPSLVVQLALGLRRWLLRLADRVVPADLALFERTTGIASTALLGAVARYDIADFLEANGPATAPAIAHALGLDADALHRTLRALSNMDVFSMSDEGSFSNNRMSRALVSGRPARTREWALYFSSGSNGAAWLDCAGTLETGQNAFARIHGENVWAWFDDHPDEREMFAHCMMGLTVGDAPLIATLYPFGAIARLCDVGGGRGALLSEIVLRHPSVKGVLCDGEGVSESARELITARGQEHRVDVVKGNFFEGVPLGCDGYILKNILHDWDDETCKKILRVVRSAMEPGARLVVCEFLVERNSRHAIGTRADLQMMVACENGRERGLDEFRALFAASAFRYERVFRSPLICVLEAIAV